MEALDLYLDVYGDSDVVSDRLDEEEWKSLGKINDMLSVLKEATKSLEGSVVSLTKGLPAMDFILTRFENGRAQYKNDTVIVSRPWIFYGPLLKWSLCNQQHYEIRIQGITNYVIETSQRQRNDAVPGVSLCI
jgi:hypothetical protein